MKRSHFLTIVSVLGLLGGVLWVLPRPATRYTTVDHTNQWSLSDAPPRREIVWKSASSIEISKEADRLPDHVSYIRPQIADSGRTLYFTVRNFVTNSPDQNLDIMESHYGVDGWSKPQRVNSLNSVADDVGPIISADGNRLYLYSNRDGGFGGMDLYVSRRDGERWTKPLNLGRSINSPADEYDPAMTPDGKRLFFASNRNERVMRQFGGNPSSLPGTTWTTTLRHDPGAQNFDLYVASLKDASEEWNEPRRLRELNTTNFNEGAPYVSPDGAFLYFASDRPYRDNESRNLDLYRAWLDDLSLSPQNLGTGINTSADETEPCLASGGFELMFSRGDVQSPSKFALHQSTAMEVLRNPQWDTSNWRSFQAMLSQVIGLLSNRGWLILFVLASLAALYGLIREIRKRRYAIPGFLLVALLLHGFIVTGSFFVYFQQSLVQKIKAMFVEEQIVATEIFRDTASQSISDQLPIGSASELPMPDRIEPTELVTKSALSVPSVAIELARPIRVGESPMKVSDLTNMPVEATFAVADPTPQPWVKEPLQRVAVGRERMKDSIPMQATLATVVPQLELVVPSPLVQRQSFDVKASIQTLTVENFSAPSKERMAKKLEPVQQAPMQVEFKPTEVKLNRVATRVAEEDTVASEKISLDSNIVAEKSAPLETLAVANLDMERSAQEMNAALPQSAPLHLALEIDSSPMLATSQTVAPVAPRDVAVVPESVMTDLPLARSRAQLNRMDTEKTIESQKIEFVKQDIEKSMKLLPSEVDADKQASSEMSVKVETFKVPDATAQVPSSQIPTADQSIPKMVALGEKSIRNDPLAKGALARRSTRSTRDYADVQINLQSLLMRRKLDEATKVTVVKQFGGNDETIAAIRRGLEWIQQHQAADGHWGLHDFHEQCKDHDRCNGHGHSHSDTAGTGLALLPMLGDGNTHQQGPMKECVSRGIAWIIKNQKPDGDLFTGGQDITRMYSHAIAAIALCECYGMTGDANLKNPAQKAIDFIVAAQDPNSGGWRYQPRAGADTSVVGWQVMALKSAQMAELNVPEKTFKESQRWLASIAGEKNQLGQFAYQPGRFNPAMTAEAILCLEYLGEKVDSLKMQRGTQFLLKNLPKMGHENSYYWYYATQAMFHLQGDAWQKWNRSLHPLLLESQIQKGPLAGTWDPKDEWERSGGRIYSTSLRVLMLEVYYRHLPIYQSLD